MGKWKVWLLIALGIVGGLVAWTLLAGNLWTATKNVCKCDTSGHKVSFVTVEPGVQLEVWIGAAQARLWFCSPGLETTRTCSMSLHTSSPIASMSSASRVEGSGAQASLRMAMTLIRERATTSQSSTS